MRPIKYTKGIKRVHVKLDADLFAKLKVTAKKQGVTVTALITKLIKNAV